jgi:RNA polymerase sigma factor (TIGR02999 family)
VHNAFVSEPSLDRELLVLVYDELRALARARLAKVPPGNTLQPTALVHEAYLRLVRPGETRWNGKGHFFGAAAEAMRQILVEQARRKSRIKHGGEHTRVDLTPAAEEFTTAVAPEVLLGIDEAVRLLEAEDPSLATLVKLRYFSGLAPEEIAALTGVSRRTVERRWRYAAAFLRQHLADSVGTEALDADLA